MATQSDEPTQPTPSANSENYLRLCQTKSSLPYDMIVKLLVDFYSDDDIASAKNILFQTAFNDRDAPRLIRLFMCILFVII